jgi:ribonuclease Z
LSTRSASDAVRVIFLGTAAARPTARRGVSCTAVRSHGQLLLVDCGEGSQRQLMRCGLGLGVDLILLTHFHLDHWYGVEPLLRTLRLQDSTRPMTISGPAGALEKHLGPALERMREKLTFELRLAPLDPGDCLEREGFRVRAVAVDHSVPSFGYALEEPQRPGRFHPRKAAALGLGAGPLFGRLQRGEDVVTAAGRPVRPEDVMDPPRPGRKVVFSGDTRPSEALVEAARDADLLVHEGTFLDEHAERAVETRHSTAREAAGVADRAAVKHLVLNHVSSRYDSEPERLLDEARVGYRGPITVAEDGMVIEVGYSESSVLQLNH